MAKLTGARSLWFQIHKWLGLALVIVLIPLSLSGALLVWPDWTEALSNPQRYKVSGPVAKPVSAYADAARAALSPGDSIAMIRLPDGKGPVVVSATPAKTRGADQPRRPGPPRRISVWLDPATATVLDRDDGKAGSFARLVHQFHGTLLVPGVGRKIVGWLGWAMFVSSLTGIWLWWPTIGKVVRGFRWKRGPLVSGNLHHMVGIWIAVPLAILSFTGAYIAFPDFFRSLEGGKGGAERAQGAGPGGARFRARPLEQTHLGVDAAVKAGMPTGAVLMVRYPTSMDASWQISGTNDASVLVDDASGAVKPAEARGSGLARTMRGLHEAHDYNPAWQTIVFLAGIAPAVLGITGVIMWLRTRGWRAKVAAARR